MASLSNTFFLLHLLLLLLLHLSSSLSTTLIETTCKSTSYPDFCVAAISSTSPQTSSTADTRGLSSIFLSLALSNATNSSSYATSLAASALTEEPIRPLLRACSLKYAAAGDALSWALRELSAESYDNAFVHASAAAEYPIACRMLFAQQKRKPAALYPPELGRMEEELRRLCTVAVEIISLLG
ncbi:hypothetical protein M5K25_021745 [Dendrobium thyrsiflorum]|uniref:Pectinesterase inhibitor domain-containing protein n=1 Tax=Dendrobium thyrsiflorum TaxID=117978 RepID=A0ABD0U4X2_DENTH